MFRSLSTVGLMLAGSILIAGCGGSGHYDPKATDPQLSSYAARKTLPTVAQEHLPDVVFMVGDNGVITVLNASDGSLMPFDLWVNQQYVINMTKGLPAHTSVVVAPETLFNNSGTNLTTVKPDMIRQVQVSSDGHLYNLAGPVKPMP